jgi:hypothetical protein
MMKGAHDFEAESFRLNPESGRLRVGSGSQEIHPDVN